MNTTSLVGPVNPNTSSGVGAPQALATFGGLCGASRSCEIVPESAPRKIPKALLVGENSQGFSYMEKRLAERGFECQFASTVQKTISLVNAQQFDLIFCPIRLCDTSLYFLLDLCDGRTASLFYFYPVEDGCWWLPAIRRGTRCWGSSALRRGEFVLALDGAIAEAQQDL